MTPMGGYVRCTCGSPDVWGMPVVREWERRIPVGSQYRCMDCGREWQVSVTTRTPTRRRVTVVREGRAAA